MAGGQRSETKLRRSTGTYILNEIKSKIRDKAKEKKKHRDSQAGRDFMAEGQDRAKKKHRDSQAGRDFMTEDQRSKTKLRRSTGTHTLNQNFMEKIRDQRQR